MYHIVCHAGKTCHKIKSRINFISFDKLLNQQLVLTNYIIVSRYVLQIRLIRNMIECKFEIQYSYYYLKRRRTEYTITWLRSDE